MRNPAIGDRVVTNNLEWGVIESLNTNVSDPVPWFRVRLDNGGIELQDASRMSRVHPFGDPDPGAPTYGCDYCPATISRVEHIEGGLCQSCRETA